MHFPAYECTERIVWRSGSIEGFYWDTVLSYANVKSLGWGMSYANWKAWRDVCKYWQTWYRGRVDTFIRLPKSGRLDELLKGFHGSGEMEVLSTRFSNVTTDRESSYWSILTQDLILFRKRLIWSLSTLSQIDKKDFYKNFERKWKILVHDKNLLQYYIYKYALKKYWFSLIFKNIIHFCEKLHLLESIREHFFRNYRYCIVQIILYFNWNVL